MEQNHSHHHHHENNETGEMAFEEKMARLLRHWIRHNEDHADNYRNWGARAKSAGLTEVEGLLMEAVDITGKITNVFEKAKQALPHHD